MARKKINTNFGKPDMPVRAVPTSFQELVLALGLSPAEYEGSQELRDWVVQNKDQKYVPPALLKAWRLEVRDDKW